MTDPQTHNNTSGETLLAIRCDESYPGDLIVQLPVVSDTHSIVVPTSRLLAMIDAADPDAMRAYLRETAPEVIADLCRPEVPEADSPEDVDELPDVEQARAAGEQIGTLVRAFSEAYAEAVRG